MKSEKKHVNAPEWEEVLDDSLRSRIEAAYQRHLAAANKLVVSDRRWFYENARKLLDTYHKEECIMFGVDPQTIPDK